MVNLLPMTDTVWRKYSIYQPNYDYSFPFKAGGLSIPNILNVTSVGAARDDIPRQDNKSSMVGEHVPVCTKGNGSIWLIIYTALRLAGFELDFGRKRSLQIKCQCSQLKGNKLNVTLSCM